MYKWREAHSSGLSAHCGALLLHLPLHPNLLGLWPCLHWGLAMQTVVAAESRDVLVEASGFL